MQEVVFSDENKQIREQVGKVLDFYIFPAPDYNDKLFSTSFDVWKETRETPASN